jgi:hypothetical protein
MAKMNFIPESRFQHKMPLPHEAEKWYKPGASVADNMKRSPFADASRERYNEIVRDIEAACRQRSRERMESLTRELQEQLGGTLVDPEADGRRFSCVTLDLVLDASLSLRLHHAIEGEYLHMPGRVLTVSLHGYASCQPRGEIFAALQRNGVALQVDCSKEIFSTSTLRKQTVKAIVEAFHESRSAFATEVTDELLSHCLKHVAGALHGETYKQQAYAPQEAPLHFWFQGEHLHAVRAVAGIREAIGREVTQAAEALLLASLGVDELRYAYVPHRWFPMMVVDCMAEVLNAAIPCSDLRQLVILSQEELGAMLICPPQEGKFITTRARQTITREEQEDFVATLKRLKEVARLSSQRIHQRSFAELIDAAFDKKRKRERPA